MSWKNEITCRSSKDADDTAEMVWNMNAKGSLLVDRTRTIQIDVSLRYLSWGRQDARGLGWRFEYCSGELPYLLFAGASLNFALRTITENDGSNLNSTVNGTQRSRKKGVSVLYELDRRAPQLSPDSRVSCSCYSSTLAVLWNLCSESRPNKKPLTEHIYVRACSIILVRCWKTRPRQAPL